MDNDQEDWLGPERRQYELSESQLDAIAELAASKLEIKLYVAIGRTVFNKILYALGLAAVVAYIWSFHKSPLEAIRFFLGGGD